MFFINKILDTSSIAELNEWKDFQAKKIRQEKGLSEDDPLPTGCIGGLYTYSLTPTTLGVIIKVKNNITEDVLDLSDYESW